MQSALRQNAIACGHPAVAKSAREVMAIGGNAADAAVAAALSSCVVEPVLSSLGGGGIGIVWLPDGTVESVDFWIAPPSAYNTETLLETVELDWPGGVKQPFSIGASSVGVWGMPLGLELLSKRYGKLGLSEVAQPSVALSQTPHPLNRSQAEWMLLLHGIHSHFGGMTGSAPEEGELFVWPGLSQSLEWFASHGAEYFYQGQWASGALESLGGNGPSAKDLAQYQVLVSPAPMTSEAGLSIYLPETSLTASLLSQVSFPSSRDKWYTDQAIAENLQLFAKQSVKHTGPSTTSIIVRDASGMCVALVLSNGSGSGIFSHGVQLNNVGGEVDLLQAAQGPSRTDRFPTRMCPVLAKSEIGQWLMMGSGGSERITAATLQVLFYNMWLGYSLQRSITAPRMYTEGGILHIEPGAPFANFFNSQDVHLWEDRHQYFGGVNAIGLGANGGLASCSDPRRQGDAAIFSN